jgi:tetratricopeptide (TPR) repeat protein
MASCSRAVLSVMLISYVASQNICDPLSERKDCGFDGVTKESCEASYCCWFPVLPNPNNIPWCFYPSNLDSEVEREFDGGETAEVDAEEHFVLGKKQLFDAKDFGKAYEHLDEAIKLNPKHTQAIYHLGLLHHQREKFQFAVMAYQHALSLEQDQEMMGVYLHKMALAFAAQNNWNDAKGAFGEALQLRPKDGAIYRSFGLELEKLAGVGAGMGAGVDAAVGAAVGDTLAKATKAYSNAISLNPSDVVAHLHNGGVLNR